MSDGRCELLCLDLNLAERLRRERIALSQVEPAAAQAKALGNPTRLALAAILLETEELCVCDLSWILERAENLVSHHLKQLRTAELVSSRRDGKMVMYSLTSRGRALLELTLAGEIAA